MRLDQETLSILALVGIGVGALALAIAGLMASRLSFLRRAYERRRAAVRGGGTAIDPDSLAELIEEVRLIRTELEELNEVMSRSIQRVGLVRFDAFEDMGGRLSFATALLDSRGDGLVLSTINGRTESRMYAKPVERGASRYNLSEEEQEAVRRALAAPGR